MSDESRKVVLAWTDEILNLHELLSPIKTPVYIVGGAVRDAYLRHPIRDIDLATPESGRKLARFIANELGAAYYALDDERDVGRVIITTQDSRSFLDVARFRGETLEDDLRDRDFSINAMAVDIHSEMDQVFDPCGGIDALHNKTLQQCQAESIAVDPIRILRGIRYSVEFGLRIEPETLVAMRVHANRIAETSKERQRDELVKLLELPKPHTALAIASNIGVLRILLPDVENLDSSEKIIVLRTVLELERLCRAYRPHRSDDHTSQFALGALVIALDQFRDQLVRHFGTIWANERPHRVLLFLAALLRHVSDESIEQYCAELRLSNAEKERWIALRLAYRRYEQVDLNDHVSIFRFWRQGGAGGVDAIILRLIEYMVDEGVYIDHVSWVIELERAQAMLRAYFDEPMRYVSPVLLVTGDQLMAELKIKPGKLVGELLTLIQEAQVRGEISTASEAIRFAHSAVGNLSSQSNGHQTG